LYLATLKQKSHKLKILAEGSLWNIPASGNVNIFIRCKYYKCTYEVFCKTIMIKMTDIKQLRVMIEYGKPD